ncbi:MAG: hypothetical protein ACI3ZS_05035, partial [Candidatus Cryptobacteroides sp.]
MMKFQRKFKTNSMPFQLFSTPQEFDYLTKHSYICMIYHTMACDRHCQKEKKSDMDRKDIDILVKDFLTE